MPAIVYNGNVYGEAPDLNALLDFISVGSTDLERVLVNTTNTYSTNHTLYTASKDCIVNVNGYASYPKTSTTGFRVCNVSVDGVFIKSSVSPALQGDVTNISFDGIYKLKKGQTLTIVLLQDSGTNMEVTIHKSFKVMNV